MVLLRTCRQQPLLGRPGLSRPGKTILEHTLDVFESYRDIDEILIVMAPGFTAAAEELGARGRFRKVVRVLAGGAERSESTSKAIDVLSARGQPAADCNVIWKPRRPMRPARRLVPLLPDPATRSTDQLPSGASPTKFIKGTVACSVCCGQRSTAS
jgi:hypothetical protein